MDHFSDLLALSESGSPEDSRFGALAVELGYVTDEQVHACLHEQKIAVQEGTPLRLGQVMVRKGYLSASQFVDILATQNKTIMRCVGCGTRHNVEGREAGTPVFCPACGKPLRRESKDETAPVNQTLREGGGVLSAAGLLLPSAAGEKFNRYELIEEIGRGGMGVVFRVRDPSLKRDVALKILKEGEGADSKAIERFQREAETAAKLRHPM